MWVTALEDKGNQLTHEYYHKKVASISVINARSSLPWSTNKTLLTQEVLIILLRYSSDLPRSLGNNHILNDGFPTERVCMPAVEKGAI